MSRTSPHGASRLAVVFAALLLTAGSAGDPADQLKDPAQEGKARSLFREVRCLVCQNESIDDSEAELASDLRRVVRQQVAAGRSDAEVRSFLVARYGKFVLLKPPFDAGTALLWFLPFGAVLGAGAWILLRRRPQAELAPGPLTEDEKARLQKLDA
jgi:cytochrome c-type biogenesis protein CcmH